MIDAIPQDLFAEPQEEGQKSYFEVHAIRSEWLRNKAKKGTKCPVCGQHVKIYAEKIQGAMARELILIYRHYEKYPHTRPLHLDTFLTKLTKNVTNTRKHGKLCLWGLLRSLGQRESRAGVIRPGYYELTNQGRRFVQGHLAVAKHVFVYNKSRLGESDESITIREALGARFDYDELFSQEPFDSVEFV